MDRVAKYKLCLSVCLFACLEGEEGKVEEGKGREGERERGKREKMRECRVLLKRSFFFFFADLSREVLASFLPRAVSMKFI